MDVCTKTRRCGIYTSRLSSSSQEFEARMEAYLEANDLWVAVEDYEVPYLTKNSTMAHTMSRKEKKARSRRQATLFVAVLLEIFTRIMTKISSFEILSKANMMEMKELKECKC